MAFIQIKRSWMRPWNLGSVSRIPAPTERRRRPASVSGRAAQPVAEIVPDRRRRRRRPLSRTSSPTRRASGTWRRRRRRRPARGRPRGRASRGGPTSCPPARRRRGRGCGCRGSSTAAAGAAPPSGRRRSPTPPRRRPARQRCRARRRTPGTAPSWTSTRTRRGDTGLPRPSLTPLVAARDEAVPRRRRPPRRPGVGPHLHALPRLGFTRAFPWCRPTDAAIVRLEQRRRPLLLLFLLRWV